MNLRTKIQMVGAILCAATLLNDSHAQAAQEMSLGIQPALSPNGKQMAFVWGGDIWVGASKGGRARQLTQNQAQEWTPKFSPDGKEIAFVSQRAGSLQIYVVPVAGGVPKKITDHSEGYYLLGWDPDGKSLIARGNRDHVGRRASQLLRVSRDGSGAEEALFDSYGARADISPDGKRVLFTREGVDLYRKGYRGSQSSQIWMYDFRKKKYTEVIKEDGGARCPMWKPDGSGFYFTAQRGGAFNLIERDLKSGDEKQLTTYKDDGVIRPTLSANGKTLVFRRGFDFYRLQLDGGEVKKIVFRQRGDLARESEVKRLLKTASEVSFSRDGLEMAFISGGDVWVMDTVLREAKQVTQTPAEEKEVIFSKDGDAIFYLSDSGVSCKLWCAKRGDSKRFWWQNSEFDLALVMDGPEVISNLSLSPDGKRIGFVRGLGDLWVADLKGENQRMIIESWNKPYFDWSPDGSWLAYSVDDDDFNQDIWIAPVDGSMLPYNVSRHPDWEGNPRWSPDGKLLAFIGRRHGEEIDIFYVWLQKKNDQLGGRDRSETKAIEAMKKVRKGTKPKARTKPKPTPAAEPFKGLFEGLKKISEQGAKPADEKKPAAKKKAPLAIDFDGLAQRVRRISIPDTAESRLLWSPDSKKLAFSAKLNGKTGIYSVEFPDKLTPSPLLTKSIDHAEWLAKDDRIVYLERGIPGSFSKGKFASYPFSAAHSYDQKAKFRVAFLQVWRAMRDHFYDGNHNGKDWDLIREKYEEAAVGAIDMVAFEGVVAMLLGELNGSHLGFRSRSSSSSIRSGEWVNQTAHLGVKLMQKGDQLVVESVIPRGPADREASRLMVGDILKSIDGVEVKDPRDLLALLNGQASLRLQLVVERGGEELKPLRLPTISYAVARQLQSDARIEANRREVERLSEGRLGYLHVARMMWEQFENFEREVFAVGAGKEGIVIDVRDNGGGFTADHLLTVLTPPQHAFTVPRGGGVGYPGDRRVYWTWGKPIVVLCNQNSFSNAEIFSHAVQTLKRGKVVGVPTAGGVISTGSASIMDMGTLRMPFRGWYKADDGEDMELNGAVPDVVIWPRPEDFSKGVDRQLSKAVQVLEAEVKAYLAKPRPEPRKASERKKNQ